jgi:hypothetical protein
MATALSVLVSFVIIPTNASAFDIGGMIGTAMAIQMQMKEGYRSQGSSGGSSHVRVSHHDSDANDGGVEHDARDAGAFDRSSRLNDRQPVRGEPQTPSIVSGALAQASERDAAAGQNSGSGRSFDDEPAFNPSR